MTGEAPTLERAVAVVAMAGRFPGARSVEVLWRNLLDRVEGIRTFSRGELEAAGVAAALLDDPDYVPAKGMLDGIDRFDERFFDYSPREAALMDPQQRLLLEQAWHALERAIGDPARYRGAAAIFASAGMSTYLVELASDPRLRDEVGLYELFLHNAPDYLATRVAYKAGLRGPAFTVQTGCSSSLVALHLACQSLLAGECDVALAGGVTARAPQVRGYLYDAGSVLSLDGHCRPFDAAASGTVPGEAVAVVAMKRLEDALRDRDHIHALVLGSAVNNDGDRKIGYTAPSVEGQRDAIVEALELGGVAPRRIGYVEAHGTATRLGDPLELTALRKAFGAGLSRRQCAVGSIKSNLGHVDAAAGVTGFIKAALCVERGALPATLHYRTPNPEAGLEDSPFFVSAETLPWRDAERFAGVSSFGIGGTNAHVVLGRAPAPALSRSRAVQVSGPAPRDASAAASPELVLLSARSPAALERMTTALAEQLEAGARGDDGGGGDDLCDVAFTSRRRKSFEHRQAVIAKTPGQAAAALRAGDPAMVRQGRGRPREVAFVFPGGGSQHAGMGRGIYETEPVFRGAIDECCAISEKQLGLDLRELMYPSPTGREEAERQLRLARHSVPAVWTTSYAMARTLAAYGLTPRWMIGHSLGEYVAACLSGVLSVRDALTLATYRALLFDRTEAGASLSVPLGEAELRLLLDERGGGVELGVINTPESCVVSGPVAAVAAFEEVLVERGLSFKRLNIEAAVHSALMAPLMADVTRFAGGIPLGAPRIPYYSNLEGRLIEASDLSPDYWAKHLRNPVRFSDNVAALLRRKGLLVLEVGPGTTLASAVAAHLPAGDGDDRDDTVLLSTMRHPRDTRGDREVLLQALGAAWAHGAAIDWAPLEDPTHRKSRFPAYPFEPARHWIDPAGQGAAHPSSPSSAGSPSSSISPAELRSAPPALRMPEAYRGDAVATCIAQTWADQLGLSAVSETSSFFALGGTSLVAVRLMSKLQRQLHTSRRLFPDEILRYPDLGALIEHLRPCCQAASASASDFSPLVLLRAASSSAPSALPLLLVHPAGGHVFHYRWLAESLPGPPRPIYGLKAPGLDEGTSPLSSIEELAEHHLLTLRAAGLFSVPAPYALAGSSLGGCVAFEMAARLRAAGHPPALLAMIDTPAPAELPQFTDHADYVYYLFGDMWRVQLSRDELRQLPAAERIPHALRQLAAAGVELGFDPDSSQRILDVFVASERAMRAYQPRRYEGSVVYFRARERRSYDPAEPERAWRPYLREGISLEIVAGDHLSMHEPPHVAELAARLGAHLATLSPSNQRSGLL